MQWFQFTLSRDDAENFTGPLFLYGAQGVQILDSNTITCFIENPSDEFLATISSSGFTIQAQVPVQQENWTALCSDVWHTVEVDQLKIRPVAGADEAAQIVTAPGEILIIPGSGFGTGHHAATRNALILMQNIHPPPLRVLDLGTGSGILAIAAEKLYDAHVDAVDTDPFALENARDNLDLNHTRRVTVIEGGIERALQNYDLIVANLYAELLCSLESEIRERAAVGATVVLSGIMVSLKEAVLTSFDARAWSREAELECDGWFGIRLRRAQ